MHIIGHSLGAHIAGYAGERVKVARITGTHKSILFFYNSFFSFFPLKELRGNFFALRLAMNPATAKNLCRI